MKRTLDAPQFKPAPARLLAWVRNFSAPGGPFGSCAKPERRLLQILFLLGAGFLVLFGVFQRLALPGVLLWDPDSWGYLAPVLTWRDHGVFQQIGSRDGFYPAIITGLLSFGGGLEGVARAQQLMGCLSILFLAGIWRTLWGSLPAAKWIDWLSLAAGILLLLLYALNPVTLFYELTLRPESVFSFFGLLQLLAITRYIADTRGTDPGWRTVLWGAVAIVLAYSCVRLKPSWALAGVLTSLPVVLVPLLSRRPWRQAILSVACGLAGVVAVAVALKGWMREDSHGKYFLPATLMTIHADLILSEWRKNPPHQDLLPILEQEYSIAASDPGAFKKLGFDPDYLFYKSPLFWKMASTGLDEAAIQKLCFQAYFEAWTGSTAGMINKIFRQMSYFAFPERRDIAPNKIGLKKDMALTLNLLTTASVPPSASEMIARSVMVATAAPTPALESPRALRGVYGFLAASSPWLPIIFILVLISGLAGRSGLTRPAIMTAVFYSSALGNAAMVSVIHALDLERYRFTYMPFLILSLMSMLVIVIVSAPGLFRKTGGPEKVVGRS